MKHIGFTFDNKNNLTLLGRAWLSQQKPLKGVVNLVHGLGEHSGRYAHVGEMLTAAGYHLVGFDLQGHGLSGGKRGHTSGFPHFLDDITQFLSLSKERYGCDLPMFLYGHSLGGNLVLNYALRRDVAVDGIIATSPHIETAFDPSPAKLMLVKVMAKFFPAFTASNELESDALSRDKQVVKAYRDDVFVHDRISARFVVNLFEWGSYLPAHADAWKEDLPLLLMHGTADRITSHEATARFAKKISGDVDLVLWKGYYHETHNDLGKEKVLQKMIAWLDDQTSPASNPPA